jgi:hypothetical protein
MQYCGMKSAEAARVILVIDALAVSDARVIYPGKSI